MSSSEASLDLPHALQHVFKLAYISNSHIEGEPLSLSEERILSQLSPLEVVESLKDLLSDLLACKKEFWESDRSELARQGKLLEGMLQKLESEVRGHIRVEQQLKLHLEEAQSRVEELERWKKGEESSQGRSSSIEKEERKHARRTSDNPKLSDYSDRRSKAAFNPLESECLRLKLALDDKTKELDLLRRNFEKLSKELALHREKAKCRESDSSLRQSPVRSPLSERENQRKLGGEVERLFKSRFGASPYKAEGKGCDGRKKQRWKKWADKGWRPVSTSTKSRPTSSLRN